MIIAPLRYLLSRHDLKRRTAVEIASRDVLQYRLSHAQTYLICGYTYISTLATGLTVDTSKEDRHTCVDC